MNQRLRFIFSSAAVIIALAGSSAVALQPAEPAPATEPVWLGNQQGATAIDKIAPEHPLIGMQVWVARKSVTQTEPVVRAIAPIFGGAAAPTTGPYGATAPPLIRIEAQSGYVVAGLVGRASQNIDGFRLIFMRVRDGKLDPADQYESRWVGGRGDGSVDVRLAGDGKPIVGILCRFDDHLQALALVQDPRRLVVPTPEVVQSLPTEKIVQEIERRGGTVVRDSVDPAHPIREIELRESQLRDGDLALLHGLTSLKRLDLSHGFNEFSDNGLAHLETLTNLESISIEGNMGRAARLPIHLRGLPRLKFLELVSSNDGNRAADAPLIGSINSLEGLSISDAFTDESMEQLSRLSNLRVLQITETPITNSGAQQLGKFHKLQSLTVFSGVIGDDGYAGLEELHELEKLTLGGWGLTPAVLKYVKAPRLQSLLLAGPRFDDGVVPYLQAMDKLEELRLRETNVTDEGVAALNSMKGLKILDLAKGSVSGAGLLKLTNLKDLKELSLGKNPIEDASLAALQNFPDLEILDLSQTHVTAASLANLKYVPKLRQLSLAGASLTDEALVHLASLVDLEILILPATHINGSGLAQLKHLSKLRHLHIQSNPITDANGRTLGELSSLRDVNLEQTAIGDATLAALAKLPNLEILAAPLTRVSDAGVKSLSSATKLRELNVSNPRLTNAAVEPLLALHELRMVGLNLAQVTDGDVERLGDLPHLHKLYIGATHVSDAAIRRMQAKSLQLMIFRDRFETPAPR